MLFRPDQVRACRPQRHTPVVVFEIFLLACDPRKDEDMIELLHHRHQRSILLCGSQQMMLELRLRHGFVSFFFPVHSEGTFELYLSNFLAIGYVLCAVVRQCDAIAFVSCDA